MPKPHTVDLKLTYDQVNVLDKLLCIAISQWPISVLDVDEDVLSVHSKILLARDEFER